MRILLAEDDEPLAKFLRDRLVQDQFEVEVASDGGKAQVLADTRAYDLVILDDLMPAANGLQVLQRIRATKQHLPILILSGKGQVEDRVTGLDSGADDYLAKPFSFLELRARVHALLRRVGRPFDPILRAEDLELDRMKRRVQRSGRPIELTPKEFALLEYLMENAGRSVTRASIVQHVWNLSFDTMTNVVDVYVNYLRKKVEADSSLKLIHTVRGVGYRLGAAG
jgi:two-component system copper resistance phosphate regulon response regulator CusR